MLRYPAVITVLYCLPQVNMFDVHLAGMLGGFNVKELSVNAMIVDDRRPYMEVRFAVRIVERFTFKRDPPQPVSAAAGISHHTIV